MIVITMLWKSDCIVTTIVLPLMTNVEWNVFKTITGSQYGIDLYNSSAVENVTEICAKFNFVMNSLRNQLNCPCQSGCPTGCPCDEYECLGLEPNPCDEIQCNNDGVCQEGKCNCAETGKN